MNNAMLHDKVDAVLALLAVNDEAFACKVRVVPSLGRATIEVPGDISLAPLERVMAFVSSVTLDDNATVITLH